PVHCASWCFQNEPKYDKMVGGRFAHHKGAIFKLKTLKPQHGAVKDVPEFEAWDETYVHTNHNSEGRTVLQVREVAGANDNITEPEPWTWVRDQGAGRVFYTASGHDERVWSTVGFQQLLKRGILWSIGEERLAAYQKFIGDRTPLTYEKVDNIPNYENRPEPLPKQIPLSPEDSMNYTQVRAGFEMSVFASEPQLLNPIFMAWDERGRMWVAETVDYPNDVRDGTGNDTIKILEDTDGDGKCDLVKVFAEGLNIPTSLTFWNGGIIVAQAPDFLFLKDEDGDDEADVRTTILSGWGINDTHAGPSNLRYGIDNWIYGAVGYSAFNGEVGGEKKQFGSGIFRMKPDGSELEFLHQFNNNTWGLGLNAAGDVFGSTANRNPAFFGGIPQTAYPDGKKGMSAKMIANRLEFDPITPRIRQVDAFGQYTAGAGYALATSDNFPGPWRDRMAFIGGPTGNLLGVFENVRDGAGYKAINRSNLLASADEWFSPVAAEVGPDGNLWVADWYNFIIQHNPTPTPERGGYKAERGKGNAHENPHRDKQHGRIYRVKWESAAEPKIKTLAGATDGELVQALGSDNQFWRLTAQRILVAEKRVGIVPQLKKLVAEKSGYHGAHALWTLEGLGGLDRETHQLALLKQNDPVLKRNAIRAIPNTDDGMQLFFDTAVVQAKDPIVRLAAFGKMAHFPNRERVELAAKELIKQPENLDDEWLSAALRASGAGDVKRGPAKITGPNLLPNPSFENVKDGLPAQWTARTYSGEAEHGIDSKNARTGKNSLWISSEKGADSSLFAKVKVKPDTDYKLEGWVRTARVLGARGAQMNAHEVQGQPRGSRTNAFNRGNPEWKKVEIIFSSLSRTELTINCLFGGWGKSTGKAWWDDVSLHEIEYEMIVEDEPKLTDGDAKRGEQIFNTHQIAACNRCHMVGGKGGPIGPPLDGIASRKKEDYILESLINPQATIAEGFKAEVSPMPPMGVLLREQEMRDVMAYLMTLKE
ncbi:MAG: c-type cytochrome, partial [Verrucomicrobiales bacterium]|nr:c-type cytochrome [Verrucomicrobiales bacterium]